MGLNQEKMRVDNLVTCTPGTLDKKKTDFVKNALQYWFTIFVLCISNSIFESVRKLVNICHVLKI